MYVSIADQFKYIYVVRKWLISHVMLLASLHAILPVGFADDHFKVFYSDINVGE